MPILGYCLYIGGTLLALLFVADLYIPKQAVREEVPHTYHIPITAAHTPGQPITFSGQTRDFGAPPPMTVVDLAANAPTAGSAGSGLASPRANGAQRRSRCARRWRAARSTRRTASRKFPTNGATAIRTLGMAFARPFSW